MIWTNLKELDFKRLRKKSNRFPAKLCGSHSLEAWGHRLGALKGEYGKQDNAWEAWTPAMQRYCEQDVEALYALWKHILSRNYSLRALALEHEFQKVIFQQEQAGAPFDEGAAVGLYGDLAARREELNAVLQEAFPPVRHEETFIPKVNNKTRGYVKGVPVVREHFEIFNPNSREQIARRLREQFGWQPGAFTDTGQPQVDEDVLKGLPYPPCKPLVEYLELAKIIGMLAEGTNGWLKLVRKGRIHGRVITNGAVTGRCTHSKPNLAQIPAHGTYGKDCRALFAAPQGTVMVGADASGLELRMLAHYMARYDHGAYGRIILEGDIHTENQKAAGLETRDNAKIFIYAFMYGAGDAKLGSIVAPLATPGGPGPQRHGPARKIPAGHPGPETPDRRRTGGPCPAPLSQGPGRAAAARPLQARGPEHPPAIRRGRADESGHGPISSDNSGGTPGMVREVSADTARP